MPGTTTHTRFDSPIGPLTLVAHAGVLSGLYFPDHRHGPSPTTFGVADSRPFAAVVDELTAYFAGELTEFTVPIAPVGSSFQQQVWTLLRRIGYGERISYAELARRIGNPAAIRAVAAANGRNPISIVVPCHRVVGSDGSLTGYAGGLDSKRFLLELEAGRASQRPGAVHRPAPLGGQSTQLAELAQHLPHRPGDPR